MLDYDTRERTGGNRRLQTMNRGIEIIGADHAAPAVWAGGSVREFRVWPEEASVSSREFEFCISSATVETEESAFSDYSGYERVIVPLDGKMELTHDGADKVLLERYQPYAFDGGARTRSRGKVKDFNVIMQKDRCSGNVFVVSLPPGGAIHSGTGGGERRTEFFYCAEGGFWPDCGMPDQVPVGEGGVLVIDRTVFRERCICINRGSGLCVVVAGAVFCGR